MMSRDCSSVKSLLTTLAVFDPAGARHMALPIPSLFLSLPPKNATRNCHGRPPRSWCRTYPRRNCAPNNLESRVLKSESFLELRWPLVLALVGEGELQVDEADLFKAVQAWVSRNPAERRRYVDEVRRGCRSGCRSSVNLLGFFRLVALLGCCSVCLRRRGCKYFCCLSEGCAVSSRKHAVCTAAVP